MTTLKLKNSINQQISEKDLLILNERQIKEISQSRKDYANGLVIDHQTVNEKVEKWVKEK